METQNDEYLIDIDSEIPLNFKFNNPHSNFSIEKNGNRIKLKSQMPVSTFTTHANKNIVKLKDKFSFFYVFNKEALAPYKDYYKKKYDEVINSKLPQFLVDNKIFKSINRAETEVALRRGIGDYINFLNQKVRYFGDWRTHDGGFFPQRYDKVEKNRYGDCKDFSSILTSVLRANGYDAFPLFVYRGKEYIRNDHPFLADSVYNHVIVGVNTKYSEEPLFFDPTNDVAYTGDVPTDISGRDAYPILGKGYALMNIPKSDLSKNKIIAISDVIVERSNENNIYVTYSGESAIEMTKGVQVIGEDKIRDWFVKLFKDELVNVEILNIDFKDQYDPVNPKFELIVKKAHIPSFWGKTNLGKIVYPNKFLEKMYGRHPVMTDDDLREYGFHTLSGMGTYEFITRIYNFKADDVEKLNCKVDHDTLPFEETYKMDGEIFIATRKYSIKNRYFPHLKNKDSIKDILDINQCVMLRSVVGY